MKIIKTILMTVGALLFIKNTACSQNLNWANMDSGPRHILHVNAGIDYAVSYGVGYGYLLKTKLPIVLNVQYSQPSGGKLLDDFKTKIGGEIRLYRINHVNFSARVYGIFRRMETPDVRFLNFGSDFSAKAGYYKQHWFAAGEFGFDKAIVTNFKHSAVFRENYPSVKDGWYQPTTGGNFYYGIQTGYSFTTNDITIKAGALMQQDFTASPTIPFYFQIGYNKRF